MKPNTLSTNVAADADATFALITDVDRLPEWNTAILRLLERPPSWTPGAEWVVEVSAMGQRWPSRSRLEEYEPGRRFAYRAQTDDGNPSFATWMWEITPNSQGCEVAVTWSINPKTFWRRALLARIRSMQLRRTEVPASLAAMKSFVERTTSGVG